jgi:hypothetical protein
MPPRRGHDSQVAECASHSAGIRYPSSRGVLPLLSIWVLSLDAEESPSNTARAESGSVMRRLKAREAVVVWFG